MTKVSTRVSGPAQLAGATAVLYTVPAGTKAQRIRFHVQNPSGAAVTLTVSIGADAADTRLLDAYSIPAAAAGVTGNVVDFYWDHAMVAGETLRAHASAATTMVATVTVDELTAG